MRNSFLKALSLIILFLSLNNTAQSKHLHLEKEYQDKWCTAQGGVTESTLDDLSRIDCLLPNYAIEFDFANKVYEGIGQAVYYASKTNLIPGVVLIMEDPDNEQKYLNKLKAVSSKYGIKYWIMTINDL